MPTIKIKNPDGTWKYVNEPSSNADTLDGKHADEFAAASDVEDLQTKVGDKTVAEQIEDSISSIKTPKAFYITIAGDDSGKYTADKTAPEILDAYRNGYTLFAVVDTMIESNRVLPLKHTSDMDSPLVKSIVFCDYDHMQNTRFVYQVYLEISGSDNSVLYVNYTENIIDTTIPIVDTTLSDTSTNTIQNKAVARAINDLSSKIGDTSVSEQIGEAIAAQKPSPPIIDVLELPTNNIREDVFYRLTTATFSYHSGPEYNITCLLVNSLPEVGQPIDGYVSPIYHIKENGTTHVYLDDQAADSWGLSARWYTLEEFLSLRPVHEFGGVVTDINNMTEEYKLYLLFETSLYSYKDGWTLYKELVGKVGTGKSAEIFNHIGNVASGDYSHAEGFYTIAPGEESHAEGYYTIAAGKASHAEGSGTKNSITITGNANTKTYTLSEDSLSIEIGKILNYGDIYAEITAYDRATLTIKVNKTLSSTALTNAIAHVVVGIALGIKSHAEGSGTIASGESSHAEGSGTIASGNVSHAEGWDTIASGIDSHAEGSQTKASGLNSHAEGDGSIASGARAHAEGYYTTASATSSHTEGEQTIASGERAHAEGTGTTASGISSHAEGQNTTASGYSSHAEGGSDSTAITITGDANANTYSLSKASSNIEVGRVINYNNIYAKITAYDATTLTITVNKTLSTTALTNASANLIYGVAFGSHSHAEGYRATASGDCSHAEGQNTTASGSYSHAEGWNTSASGDYSHAEGNSTRASGSYQHVQGKYNIVDTSNKYAHIVGNGTANNDCSNAHTVDWDGLGWFAGGLKVGGTGQNDGATEVALKTDIVNSNWNASEGEDGHIEGRTHYDSRVKTSILERTTIEFTDDNDAIVYLPVLNPLENGKAYTVVWDGVEYKCTLDSYIGDGAYQQYPFCIVNYDDTNEIEISSIEIITWPYDGSTVTHTVEIYTIGGELKKLNPKYLPEGVGYEGKGYKIVSFSTETVDDITVAERFTPNVVIVAGNKYRITVGDNAYELVAYTDTNGFLTIGAPVASSGTGWDFSQIPVSLYNNAKGNTYFAYNTLGTYDISVEEETDVTYKIDSKYLPTQDWNADEDSSGHIRNRTHYTEITSETVLCNKWGYYESIESGKVYKVQMSNSLVFGNTYMVVFDDVEYICVCFMDDDAGLPAIGAAINYNESVWAERYDFTEFPFIIYDNDGEGTYYIEFETSGVHNIRVSEVETVVHRLDEKYMPLLTSPNGTKFMLSVNDDGTITTTAVT